MGVGFGTSAAGPSPTAAKVEPNGPLARSSGAYVKTFTTRWSDMDPNGHVRNTAYLDLAGDVRMMFFAEHGFGPEQFEVEKIGPVIRKDEIEYLRELRLLDQVEVDLRLARLSENGARFVVRNEFRTTSGDVVARVTSSGGWLDLATRRFVVPPAGLGTALARLPRTEDFEHG